MDPDRAGPPRQLRARRPLPAGCAALILLGACGGDGAGPDGTAPPPNTLENTSSPPGTPNGGPAADAVSVTATGGPGNYTFAVAIRSDETGCDQYANWWEVVTDAGSLVYRRILAHSHPSEQPFERSGGPVDVQPDDIVVVRAHLFPSGYGGAAMRGSVADGFTGSTPEPGWAADLETVAPQPDGCLF